MRHKRQIWASENFIKDLKTMFPASKSYFHATEQFSRQFRKSLYKKGSVLDIFWIMGGIIALAVVVIFIFHFISSSNDAIQQIPDSTIPPEAKAVSSWGTNLFPGMIDGMFFFIFFALVALVIVMATLVPVHPVFIIFYLISLVLAIFFGGFISNMYEMLTLDNALSATASKMVFMAFLFKYLPWFIGLVGLLLAVIMYKAYGRGANG